MADARQDLEFREGQPLLRSLRPTFSTHAKVSRQRFRGRLWYVAQDPVSLQYFRFGPAEHRVVEKLDGQHTLEQIHRELLREMGAEAPTFQDIVSFVHMLRGSNLLEAGESADSAALYERVRQKKMQRIKGVASNFLFLTIPLVDPDRFLTRTLRYVRFLFTRWFFAIWVAVVGAGIIAFFVNIGELAVRAEGILSPANLPLLWLCFVFLKVIHELSHAYLAKRFGCEVHRMGILFLVFTPTAYVDLTSLWSVENEKRRALVGCVGMMAELMVASAALFLFLVIGPGTLRSLAYNVVFVASVSAVLFNGNPLLRFDAYYILSDWLEIPNLWQNSRRYILYLGKRYLLGMEEEPPAKDPGEKAWLLAYGIASTCYRTMITVGIVLFVSSKIFGLGVVLGAAAAFVWFVLPLGRLLHYLLFASRTRHKRVRCVAVAALGIAAFAAPLALLRVPHYVRAPCVLTPEELVSVRARWGGFVEHVAAEPGGWVEAGQLLAECRNEELPYRVAYTEKAIEIARVRLAACEEDEDVAGAQVETFRIAELSRALETLRERVAALRLRAPCAGRLVAPDIANAEGRFLQPGDAIALVARAPFNRVVAMMDQAAVADVRPAEQATATVRFGNDPGRPLRCRVKEVLPQASHEVPARGITDAAGGPIILDPTDPSGERTLLGWFHVELELPSEATDVPLGTTGVARFRIGRKPLLEQWYERLLRVLRSRFLL